MTWAIVGFALAGKKLSWTTNVALLAPPVAQKMFEWIGGLVAPFDNFDDSMGSWAYTSRSFAIVIDRRFYLLLGFNSILLTCLAMRPLQVLLCHWYK